MIPDEIQPKYMNVPDSDEYKAFVTFLEKEYGIKNIIKNGDMLEIELED